MKYLTKLVLIVSQLSVCAFGAEKPDAPEAAKPVLKIAAFSMTMKSSNGPMEIQMDDQGKITFGGKHIATAQARGEIIKPSGSILVRINENGDVVPAFFGAALKVTPDGTLSGGGETHSWVDGKLNVGEKGSVEITPKDSPSKAIATLIFLSYSTPPPQLRPK